MSLYIVKGDLLKQKVDAIVIPSAPHLRMEGAIGEKVKNICGKKLIVEMKQLENIKISEAVITNAYNLDCKKLIHVANPKWNGGDDNEDYDLKSSYLSCLELAQDFGLESIAFPILSIGAYEYPKRRAINIAIETIEDFLCDYDMDVCLVVYTEDTYKTYSDIFKKHAIIGGHLEKHVDPGLEAVLRERRGIKKWYKKGLPEVLENGPEVADFNQKLIYYMSIKGLTKEDCYKGVMSKTMFNNLLNGSVPKKYTIVTLGIKMGLNEYEINDLLDLIYEELDYQNEKDQIIIYDLYEHKTISEINNDLISQGHPPLKQHK